MAIKESVEVEQSKHKKKNGEYSYTVLKAKNYTGNTVNEVLTKEEIDILIAHDIDVIIKGS